VAGVGAAKRADDSVGGAGGSTDSSPSRHPPRAVTPVGSPSGFCGQTAHSAARVAIQVAVLPDHSTVAPNGSADAPATRSHTGCWTVRVTLDAGGSRVLPGEHPGATAPIRSMATTAAVRPAWTTWDSRICSPAQGPWSPPRHQRSMDVAWIEDATTAPQQVRRLAILSMWSHLSARSNQARTSRPSPRRSVERVANG